MSTAPKKSVTAVSAAVAQHLLTLTFGNGERITVDANMLSDDIKHQAMMHGLKQKLIDAAAIARNPETGMTATLKDKYDAVCEVFDRITSKDNPTWNKVRGNGGEGSGSSAKGGLLARAMMRITSKSHDDITAFLAAKSKEEIAALRKNPRVAEMIAKLQAEAVKTDGIDSDALLDGLLEGADEAPASAEAPAPKAKRAPKPKAE